MALGSGRDFPQNSEVESDQAKTCGQPLPSHRCPHIEVPSHTSALTHRCPQQVPSHTGALTHRCTYTQVSSHTGALTYRCPRKVPLHRCPHTHEPCHRGALTHRCLVTQVHSHPGALTTRCNHTQVHSHQNVHAHTLTLPTPIHSTGKIVKNTHCSCTSPDSVPTAHHVAHNCL